MNRRLVLNLPILLIITLISTATTSGCTVITTSSSTSTYFGYNEDRELSQFDQSTTISVFPAEDGKLGYMAVIAEEPGIWSLRVGLNSEGVAVSGNGINTMALNRHPERKYDYRTHVYYRVVLQTCRTVAEAIDVAENFNFSPTLSAQFHIADALGNAVIISPQTDGEMGYFVKTGNSIVSTNANMADLDSGGYDGRYDIVTQDLDRNTELQKDEMIHALDLIHQDNFEAMTYYSVIFDLQQKIIYFYLCHDFEVEVQLDLGEELDQGRHDFALQDLFDSGDEILETAEKQIRLYGILVTGFRILSVVVLLGLVVHRIWVARKGISGTGVSNTGIKWLVLYHTIVGILSILFVLVNAILLPYLLLGELARSVIQSGVITVEIRLLIIAWVIFVGFLFVGGSARNLIKLPPSED